MNHYKDTGIPTLISHNLVTYYICIDVIYIISLMLSKICLWEYSTVDYWYWMKLRIKWDSTLSFQEVVWKEGEYFFKLKNKIAKAFTIHPDDAFVLTDVNGAIDKNIK